MRSSTPAAEAITAAWRQESARLVGALTRMTGDLALAEDLAQDALVAALEQWPRDGIPRVPGAWLMTTAKRRAVDRFRREDTLRKRVAELAHDLADHGEEVDMPGLEEQVDHVEDDVLRLMFLCCHPVLTADSRAALTLRLVAGLSTAEIARGFLVTEAAMGRRLTRARHALAEAGVAAQPPSVAERRDRVEDVLAVVYLVFNEGYVATAGEQWTRPDLCHEAIRLARMLAALVPEEPETHALQALLELQAARLPARTGEDGMPVLLEEQDRGRWDALLLRRGLAALGRAEECARRGSPVGGYFLQASIAAEHARAATVEQTDWTRIARWYDVLAATAPGPVVEVNRAVAHGRARGPEAGLEILAALPEGALADSPLRVAVTADLLLRAGRVAEAAVAFGAAAGLTRNEAEAAVLRRRAGECREKTPGPVSDPDATVRHKGDTSPSQEES